MQTKQIMEIKEHIEPFLIFANNLRKNLYWFVNDELGIEGIEIYWLQVHSG